MTDILPVLENELRRRILSILSLRPSYIFELAKFLNTSQQLITKHIRMLEKAGLVYKVGEEESPLGPRRILYSANLPMLSIIDFLEDFTSFEDKQDYIDKILDIDKELREIQEEIKDLQVRLKILIEKRQNLIKKLSSEDKLDLIDFIEKYIKNID